VAVKVLRMRWLYRVKFYGLKWVTMSYDELKWFFSGTLSIIVC